MSDLTDRQWFLGAVILYGISAFYAMFLWRRGFRHHNRATYLLLLIGFALHTAAMFKRGFSYDRCPIHNIYEATMFIVWTIVAAYLALGWWGRLSFLGAFASPVLFATGVFALMPALDPKYHPLQGGPAQVWSSIHAGLALLSYGAFGLSAVAGLMYLTQEHNLKFNKLRALLSLLPPIERLEFTMGRLLLAGFVLLTAGLALAGRIPRPEGVSYWSDPKVIWSILVWFLYFGLLLMRWRFGHRGRRFARGLIGAFAFVLLTFWSTNLLSTLHNPAP